MMTTQEFSVTGMSCEHCEASVREEVSEVPGVTGVDVSATTGVLTITADGEVDESAVIAAVEEAGYTVTAR
ncbi:heavy-metal-associated domain-containing protein [Corynebacterium zhongnanshanii]|uniref:Heavy-metal-associated domain-containing protein n=2 Tax=Corynebacterium zhongnanshanii TaxID=2768834 RepID=A0ABQ6VJH0_9CORY|nr:heavy-metal-associated domain-containing protein [Corynebacterium zhongnanshanii]